MEHSVLSKIQKRLEVTENGKYVSPEGTAYGVVSVNVLAGGITVTYEAPGASDWDYNATYDSVPDADTSIILCIGGDSEVVAGNGTKKISELYDGVTLPSGKAPVYQVTLAGVRVYSVE